MKRILSIVGPIVILLTPVLLKAFIAGYTYQGPTITSVYTGFNGVSESKKVVGTGAIIAMGDLNNNCDKCRYFVLTASHVAQGSDLKIYVGDEELVPLNTQGRIADIRRDVEIIEIRKPHKSQPLAWYRKFPDGTSAFAANFKVLNSEFLQSLDTRTNFIPFWVGPQLNAKVNDSSIERPFMVLPPRYFCSNQVADETVGSLFESSYGDTLFAGGTVIAPGMSGAPIFKKIDKELVGVFSLEGIAIKFERFGISSFFANKKSIMGLFNQYLTRVQDQPRTTEPIYWRLNNGLLYREFCESWYKCNGKNLEIAPENPVSGGGTEIDGSEDFQNPFQNNCESLKHSEVLGIAGGLRYFDQNTLGFEVSNLGGSPLVYLEANLASLDFIAQNSKNFGIRPIKNKSSLIPILRFRYGLSDDEKTLRISYDDFPEYLFQVKDEIITISTESPRYNGFDYEILNFNLDSQGRLLDKAGQPKSKSFLRVIEVNGPITGTPYYIDIGDLFFTDLYRISKSNDQIQEIKKSFFRGSALRIRPKKALNIYKVIEFHRQIKQNVLLDTFSF